jgi:chaperonin GroES
MREAPLRPLRDRIVVQPLDDAQAGMIAVVRHGRPRRGLVVSVGPGRLDRRGVHRPWGTKPGDVVQFTDVCTYPSYHDAEGRIYLVLQEADVCGVECEELAA